MHSSEMWNKNSISVLLCRCADSGWRHVCCFCVQLLPAVQSRWKSVVHVQRACFWYSTQSKGQSAKVKATSCTLKILKMTEIVVTADLSWQWRWSRCGREQAGQDGAGPVCSPVAPRLPERHLPSTRDHGLWWRLLDCLTEFHKVMYKWHSWSRSLPLQIIAGWAPRPHPRLSLQQVAAERESSGVEMVAVCQQVHWEYSVMGSMTVGTTQMRCTVVSRLTWHKLLIKVLLLALLLFSALFVKKNTFSVVNA